ncbi:MAG: penicillin-binding protein activator [Oceanobacter sp.]
MRGKIPGLGRTLFGVTITGILVLQGCGSAPVSVESQTVAETTETVVVETPQKPPFIRAQEAIWAGDFVTAREVLQQLQSTELTRRAQTDWFILAAQLSIGVADLESASAYMSELEKRLSSASDDQEVRIKLVTADWYEATGEHLAAARIRDFLAPALGTDLAAQNSLAYQNHQAIWRNLQQVPQEQLRTLALESEGTTLGQWMALAAISLSSISIDEQLAAIAQWQNLFPNHPAAASLPGSLAYLKSLAIERPRKIALLLPLSGPLAHSGQAVRDGFMASYYGALSKHEATPELIVYDSTAVNDLATFYGQAVLDDIDWVIGPINKDMVNQLQTFSRLPIPTLALNRVENQLTDLNAAPTENLFQFGLPPEDEALQIARLAHEQGLHRALVIVPEGTWGDRIYQAFQHEWQNLGGEIAEVAYYRGEKDFNPDIRSMLNIDESAARARKIRQIVGTPIQFEPRPREDADWLFMVAQPQQARQIKPTLAFNFAGRLPVYATSHVYSGHVDEYQDKDLNGVRFCDLPWVLTPNAVAKNVETNTPGGQGSYLRLYAMGANAYQLSNRVMQMKAFPYSRVQGVTGTLRLNGQQQVERETVCRQFSNGIPAPF